MCQITVSILASDPVTADGAAAYLRTSREIRLVPPETHEADVLLVLTTTTSEETLDQMTGAIAKSRSDNLRIVLVTDAIRKSHLMRAIRCGLVSVLPRREADYERIVRAIVRSRAGRSEMPDEALSVLIDQVRLIQNDVLTPLGLTPGGLDEREVEVLKRLADGLDTAEIARQLNYSERTIKGVLHGMMTRLNLRNRSHAVAYGLRNGAF